MPAIVRAQDSDSIWSIFDRNRVMRNVDREGNTATALSLIDTIEPILSFDTAYNLQLAIQNYEQFVAVRGTWDLPHRDWFGLTLGNDRKGVRDLKRRLMINGDMPVEERIDDVFDERLDAAVRLFQARHGLIINGQIDEPTFYALSVPTDERLNQLRLNALRIEQWASALTDRYVVVNVPAAKIEAVENSAVVQRHTAVVGKVDRATPILNSKVHQIKFNPYWTVPKSIIEKDLIKYMNEDPQYLTNYKIRIFDGNGTEIQPHTIDWSTNEAVQYTFRQDPGAENSMGHCKIDFYNPHNVYLHDTPQKALFGENARFHSSGCVRVEGVDSLAAWLLRDNGGWDLPAVQAAFASNERLDVPLNNQVPIHTTYITAWANRQGTVSFRDDVYNYDAQGKVVFET
ncbi:MAG TPA: L,D-transpeptidase family protein [Devosiaceae bacterium]|jgi:murein L,D-transpeptidase YcbB/YkuD|nr:L,D-transpeptidase family protein [Devosiaceae bacterium]